MAEAGGDDTSSALQPHVILPPTDSPIPTGPRMLVQFRTERVFVRDSIEYNRIVNLTDAVVAIAITLLVLQLSVPTVVGDDRTADVGAVLRDLQAPAVAFCLSFVIIAFSWFGHHRFTERLLGFDNKMIFWNFCYLFTLVLVPFASDLVGNYGDHASALIVYALIMALLFGIDYPGRILAHRRGLLADHYTRKQWWAHGCLSLTSSAVFLLSIPVFIIGAGTVGPSVWIAIWPLSVVVGRWVKRVDAEALDQHTAASAAPD